MGVFCKRSSIAVTICVLALLTIGLGSAWAQGGNEPGAWMSDPELDQIRGGYSGFYFGVYFSGYWDNLGNVDGSLFFDGGIHEIAASPELPAGGPVGRVAGDGAVIQAYVGNFHGMNGICQIVQSPGSYNIIHNNLLMNFTIINVADESALPALRSIVGNSW